MSEKKSVEIGIDLSEADDLFEALAHSLETETYISELKLAFPDIPLNLHWLKRENQSYSLNSFFARHPLIDGITEHPDRTEMLKVAFDLDKMLEGNNMIPPARRTGCVGRQDWLEPEFRPPHREIFLREEVGPPTPETTYWGGSNEWAGYDTGAFLESISRADQVVTDNCNIAAIASAYGVRSIVCLEMYGNPDRLTNLPHVKTFKRRSETLQAQYATLHEYAEREWKRYDRYPQFLNVGNARQFITNEALQYCRGYGIDVGSNQWPFPGAISCDLANHDEAFRKGPFDFVFSSHCLEHIKAWETELKLWHDSLDRDGIMFIYVPHPLMEAWLPEGPWVRGGWHVQSPDPLSLVKHLRVNLKMEIVNYTTRPDSAWSFWVVARKA